jgi:hypothetical protein
MSAMSELDYLLTEYSVSRNALDSLLTADVPMLATEREAAYRRVVAAGDAIRDTLLASLGPLGIVQQRGVHRGPPPLPCAGAGKKPVSTTVTEGDWMRGMCGVCGSEGHRLTKDSLIPAHAASFRRDRDRV